MEKVLIVYHRTDYDGIFSACLAKKAMEAKGFQVKMFPYNYGDEIRDGLIPTVDKYYTTAILVDITLPVEIMSALCDLNKLLWIDHHITALNDSIKYGYGDVPGLRSTEVAAVELTWSYFFPNIPTPDLIQYLSAWDVHDKRRFPWEEIVAPLQLALKSRFGTRFQGIWENIFEDLKDITSLYRFPINELLIEGKLIRNFLSNANATSVKSYGFDVLIAGKYKACAMLTTTFSSQQFESVVNEYDMVMAINCVDDHYNLSIYVEPERLSTDLIDFSAGDYLRANYGGGGHRGAAGCQLTQEQFFQLMATRRF